MLSSIYLAIHTLRQTLSEEVSHLFWLVMANFLLSFVLFFFFFLSIYSKGNNRFESNFQHYQSMPRLKAQVFYTRLFFPARSTCLKYNFMKSIIWCYGIYVEYMCRVFLFFFLLQFILYYVILWVNDGGSKALNQDFVQKLYKKSNRLRVELIS